MTEPYGQPPTDPTSEPSAPVPPAPAYPGYQAPAEPAYQQPAYPAYQQPTYQQPTYPGYAPAAPPTNQKALISMILGIVGLTIVPILASIPAVILGHMSRKEIARTGESGGGMATAGLIMGYIGSIGYIIAIVAFVLFFAAIFAAGGVSTT